MKNLSYSLLDSGDGRKLEQFGPYVISRPCAQAVWRPTMSQEVWKQADALFTREGDNRWIKATQLPSQWTIETSQLRFKIQPTDFGHLGIFPEQRPFWLWIQKTVSAALQKRKQVNVLNLFAYSGGSTLAAAKAGAHVCHLDASKGMVSWAKENAELNDLTQAPIRWIVDDAEKFLVREIKRGNRYDGIILDPPTFGRGAKGEIFKIEEDIHPLLSKCKELLSDHPLFVLFSCHTPGFTPLTMQHVLSQYMGNEQGKIEVGEMILEGDKHPLTVPSGTFARWTHASLNTSH